jgi:hypothetical protein
MKSGLWRGGVIAAVIAFGAGTAQAQPTAGAKDDTTGMFCVYKQLTSNEDYETVARVFLYDDTPEELIGRAAVLLNSTANECATTHMVTQSKAASMADMGLYGSVIDYLQGDLKKAGVSAKALKAMFSVYDELSDEEHDKFFDADWRSDVEFTGKLRKGVIAAGLPKKDETIDTALTIFEVSAMADQAIFTFLVDDL